MNTDLMMIRSVTGLSEAELAIVNELVGVWWAKRTRNILRMNYYDSHNRLKDLGISIPPQLKRIETYVEWPTKAVDYLADRTVLEGFTFKDGKEANAILDAVLEANDFGSLYSQAVTDTLISCFSLLAATRGADGEPEVLLTAHSARDSAVIWDFRLNRVKYALVVADVRLDSCGKVCGPKLVNLFTPNEVITLGWRRNGRWVIDGRWEHPQGRPLVEAIRYKPRIGRPLGCSRISRAVMSITDSAVREALRSEVSAEFFTAPQKYILGADDGTFDDKPQWEAYIGCWMALTVNSEGETPQLGQLPQGSMQPHSDYERMLAARFSGATDIPVASLGVIHDNPASAEAIFAEKENIVIRAQNFNRENTSALNRIAKLAIAIAENKSVADLPDEVAGVMPRFVNPSAPSIASRTDAVVKQAEAVPEFAATDVFWEQLGYSAADIARIMSGIRRTKTKDVAIAQALAASQKSATPPLNEIGEEPKAEIKALNGAQTQSLIAIMAQFSSGQITEGQATNLISAAIGLSREDARNILNGKLD